MNYHDVIKIAEEGCSNVALRLTDSDQSDYSRSRNVFKASWRFVQTAYVLPEESFVGLRMQHDREGRCVVNAFTDADSGAVPEDFEWIFDGCAVVETAQQDCVFGLSDEGRRIYTLRYNPQESGNAEEPSRRVFDDFVCDDDRPAALYSDGFALMDRLGGTVEIIASSERKGKGWIIFSLSDEMPLRMRTMLSRSFENTTATEIEPDARLDDIEPLPTELLRHGICGLLTILMSRQTAQTEAEQEYEESPEDSPSQSKEAKEQTSCETPIEDLDLSIRSYNCLKRAGINTVEQLSPMTDEELLRVRNLGRRCIEEIKQKLSETSYLSTPAPLTGQSYTSMLDELIGLQCVKEQVRKITAFAKMQKDISLQGRDLAPVAMNMEFKGNPGTAKTTVARIIAGIFNEIGLLSSNELVEVGRADLIAKYEGQTAEKVKSVFQKAKGKVLFIDEAYSLVEHWDGEYGDEAISTIVQEMENNRSDTIVIFAGYPDKMAEFISRNPGLRSRVPFTISFNDYSADEMVQIAELEAQKRGFVIGKGAREKVASICQVAAHHPEMGNGRFCRNLVEGAIMDYAARVYGGDEVSESDFTLREQDISTPAILQEERKTAPIGFAI